MSIRKYISALIGVLICLQLSAQTEAGASLDSNKMLIGDHRTLSLSINSAHELSEVSDDLKPFIEQKEIEIIRESNWSTNPEKNNWSKEIIFSVYDTGYYSIPPIPISYRFMDDTLTSFSDALLLRVNTVEVSDSTQLAPIKNIIEEPLKLSDFIPYLIGLLLLALIVGGIIFYRKKRLAQPLEEAPVIIRPPHEVALEKLSLLKEKKLWQQGLIKEYQSELTFIVREYIEGRYHVPALESTTDEILMAVQKIQIDPGHQEYLRRLLQQADLVKFAKATPPVDIHEKMFIQADEFIRQTKHQWKNEEEE